MVPHFFADSPASELIEQLRRVATGVTRATNRRMLQVGVSYSRARILACLRSRGPLRARDLAHLFGQAPRTITEAIDGLERDGFLVRAADSVDRRVKRISLTEEGRRAIERADALRSVFAQEIGEALGTEDVAQLADLLDRLERYLVVRDRPAVHAGRSH